MSDAFLRMLTRVPELDADHVWSLAELAQAAGLSPLDAKPAVEDLVACGELIRKGWEHYARPVRGQTM